MGLTFLRDLRNPPVSYDGGRAGGNLFKFHKIKATLDDLKKITTTSTSTDPQI